jgi:hypothetical protein
LKYTGPRDVLTVQCGECGKQLKDKYSLKRHVSDYFEIKLMKVPVLVLPFIL